MLERDEFSDLIHACGFDFDETMTMDLIANADCNGDGTLTLPSLPQGPQPPASTLSLTPWLPFSFPQIIACISFDRGDLCKVGWSTFPRKTEGP